LKYEQITWLITSTSDYIKWLTQCYHSKIRFNWFDITLGLIFKQSSNQQVWFLICTCFVTSSISNEYLWLWWWCQLFFNRKTHAKPMSENKFNYAETHQTRKKKYRRPRYSRFCYTRFWLFADLKTANNEGKLPFLAKFGLF